MWTRCVYAYGCTFWFRITKYCTVARYVKLPAGVCTYAQQQCGAARFSTSLRLMIWYKKFFAISTYLYTVNIYVVPFAVYPPPLNSIAYRAYQNTMCSQVAAVRPLPVYHPVTVQCTEIHRRLGLASSVMSLNWTESGSKVIFPTPRSCGSTVLVSCRYLCMDLKHGQC